MTEFTLHTKETAGDTGAAAMAQAEQKWGMVPNLIAKMAEAPAVAEAYLALADALGRSSLSPAEAQTVLLSVSRVNECHYCMAAHSAIAEMQQVPAEAIEALRSGSPIPDAKLEALRRFTVSVLEKRGWVSDEEIEPFLAAGFTKGQVLEVILGISMKTLSNYVNHIVQTPVDAAFQAKAWAP